MMDSGQPERHLTRNVDSDPKRLPRCRWPLRKMPSWELDIDGTKMI